MRFFYYILLSFFFTACIDEYPPLEPNPFEDADFESIVITSHELITESSATLYYESPIDFKDYPDIIGLAFYEDGVFSHIINDITYELFVEGDFEEGLGYNCYELAFYTSMGIIKKSNFYCIEI